MAWRGWLVWMTLLWVLAGCARSVGPARAPGERIDVPDPSSQYMAEARPEGIMGPGSERLQAEVAEALAQRGARAESDGALMAAASWMLSEANKGNSVDGIAMEAAVRHFGFAGVVVTSVTFDMGDQDAWRDQLSTLPANIPLTRYGIRVSPSGRSASVVFGAMEATFDAIPRVFEPGESVTLKGQVGTRFKSCHIYLTKPDGKVEPKDVSSRDFDATFVFQTPGKYQLEVMGDGPTGPVIALNIPLYVGVSPDVPQTSVAGESVDPERAEARMLELLNEARRRAGVGPVRADAELREIALAHSEDMADEGFFGHVSPASGTPEDRQRRSGVLVSAFGENVALAATPEGAHEGLMQSPGHRDNMLRPDFTHVGIGATNGDNGLLITMNFGRRPNPSDLPASAAQIEAAIAALRAEKNLPAVPVDRVYRVGAQAGALAFADGGESAEIDKAVAEAMSREVNRLQQSRAGGCTLRLELLELKQLRELPVLTRPQLKLIGIGAQMREDKKGKRLATVLILEGAPCQ